MRLSAHPCLPLTCQRARFPSCPGSSPRPGNPRGPKTRSAMNPPSSPRPATPVRGTRSSHTFRFVRSSQRPHPLQVTWKPRYGPLHERACRMRAQTPTRFLNCSRASRHKRWRPPYVSMKVGQQFPMAWDLSHYQASSKKIRFLRCLPTSRALRSLLARLGVTREGAPLPHLRMLTSP